MAKFAVMVTAVDMSPIVPGQEDVIGVVHIVAQGSTNVDVAADAHAKAMPIFASMKDAEGKSIFLENHAYHAVINILGPLPEPGQASGIVVPQGAAVQDILKRGEIRGIPDFLKKG